MYKVLIVDDEPLIREGLSTLIDWEDYGFQVAYAAKDGLDALEHYERLRPDLLIVDIRMPGMDGLQLIETIRSKNWTPKLLILSGYADFDYAKKAIKCKVEGYILKPVDEDELIEYLVEIKKNLDRERELARQSGHSSQRQREALIQSVLTGGGEFTGSLSSRASELDLVWKQYQVLLLLIQFDSEHQVDVLSKARQTLEEWAEENEWGVVFMRDLQIGLLLRGNYPSITQLARLYEEISNVWKDQNFKFYAAIGRSVYRFVDIHRSYEDAFELLKRKFFAQTECILSWETAPELVDMIEGEMLEEEFDIEIYAEKLYYAIDVASKESIHNLLGQLLLEMMRFDLSEHDVKTACMQMIHSIMNRLVQQHEDLRTEHQEAACWIVNLYHYDSIHQLFAVIEERLLEIADRLDAMGSDTLVKRMIDLIHRNYHENLKLESLAEVFNYNSAYLGKMFKNQTGEYFNTYLDKVRIEKAKQLLEEGLRVYQVAERVGYTNVDYFHSKFKRYTGTAPSAYRQNKQESSNQ